MPVDSIPTSSIAYEVAPAVVIGDPATVAAGALILPAFACWLWWRMPALRTLPWATLTKGYLHFGKRRQKVSGGHNRNTAEWVQSAAYSSRKIESRMSGVSPRASASGLMSSIKANSEAGVLLANC
jgi:hypothetical protein